MTAVHLRRVDPASNMHRFYQCDVQPDLFGGVLLVKKWDASARTGARLPSVTTRKPLPPCSERPSANGGGANLRAEHTVPLRKRTH
jgi:hypothetical protein